MSASVSPLPSGEMNSSHSSGSSSVSGYVVVAKDEGHLLNLDGSKIGKTTEIPANSESLSQGGSMSQNDHELADRVQNLSKENEQLKTVLLQNNELLEKYFEELADMQESQKQTSESLRKGYDRAREMVKKLREKNGTLKTELKYEQNKILQLEGELSKLKEADENEKSAQLEKNSNDDKAKTYQVQPPNEVVKRLESEKATLEMNYSKLQEHISRLKAMQEAEPNTETDDCDTLVSIDTLSSDILLESPEAYYENLKKLETEKEILKVKLDEMKIESEQHQQNFKQLEEERDQLLKKIEDFEQGQVLEEGDIKLEVAENQASTAALSEQIATLTEQLRVQTEVMGNLRKEQGALRQERDMYQKKAKELEQVKRTTENVEIMKQQQQNSPEKGRGNQEAQRDLQDNLCKVKKTLWEYQKREGGLLNRENAVLEKEEKQKEVMKENENLKHQLAEAQTKVEALSHKGKGQEEEVKTLRRQLSSVSDELTETHEREVSQLKESMQTACDNADQLRDNVDQLMEKNEHLQEHVEELKLIITQKEQEIQALKEELTKVSNELNETKEQEVNHLKEELSNKTEALENAEISVEYMKAQVTQLIRENETLAAEKDRLGDECTQQENMYQEHLHKIAEDNEKQRLKRDKIIEGLRKQVSTLEADLQKTRLEKENESVAHVQLQEDHERIIEEYDNLIRAYQKTSDTNKLKQYEDDFRMERDAREKQHGELLGLTENVQRLQRENQRYQDEIYQLNNRGFEEMQRRHASFTTSYPPQNHEPPREWFSGMPLCPRGSGDPLETGREGDIRSPGREQPAPGPPEDENDWQCPTCRRLFPNFDTLQIHAVECQGHQRPPSQGDLQQNQCPSCMELFPDIETLELHVEECLDQQQ
ncbi:hypothetical protein AWC38_SpisGene12827 [Stylophora pistillata]|uniref:CCHC NOA-type domain-containing protein n=1 Tax=Stylophora pistillata TaxID=50429 RepID=A0A2B4S232_STYPI|nr:hypothetical protein AWC38_SpisGene12827 [Stylophora pistillata]